MLTRLRYWYDRQTTDRQMAFQLYIVDQKVYLPYRAVACIHLPTQTAISSQPTYSMFQVGYSSLHLFSVLAWLQLPVVFYAFLLFKPRPSVPLLCLPVASWYGNLMAAYTLSQSAIYVPAYRVGGRIPLPTQTAISFLSLPIVYSIEQVHAYTYLDCYISLVFLVCLCLGIVLCTYLMYLHAYMHGYSYLQSCMHVNFLSLGLLCLPCLLCLPVASWFGQLPSGWLHLACL